MAIATKNPIIEASSQDCCPLCSKDRYCGLIKDEAGKTYKVVCQWTDALLVPEGWKYAGLAKDGRSIFASTDGIHHKPRKSKKYPKQIQFHPRTEIAAPTYSDLKISLKELGKDHVVRLQSGNPGGADSLYVVHQIFSKQKQGQHYLAVKLKLKDSLGVGILEVPMTEIAEIVTHDPKTGAKEQFIEYQYSPNQKVVRTQWSDRRPAYGKQTKLVRPYWQTEGGDWKIGKGGDPWPLYRQDEAVETLKNRGIVFAVGGESAVESIRSIGLVATCNQGGEGGFPWIAKGLKDAFSFNYEQLDEEPGLSNDDSGLKPLLVIWADNDKTGRDSAAALLKACHQQKVTAVAINPLILWPEMPEKGDAKDWIDYIQGAGVPDEQMYRQLENAIEQAIDEEEEENQYRWQRSAWKAPMSYMGEIGEWIMVGKGEEVRKVWQPLCNFDFVVEREIQDDFGGALVLQVKRSFESHQQRVILNSTDYTKVDTFIDAMKKALGVGIVCNLSRNQLQALFNVRLHEYRTTRQGKVFKRIDRYGQQVDGVWVFRDRQYTKEGNLTDENESGWVFNPSLGKDDFIPCPELAPEDPEALSRLIAGSRKFFGSKNIYQVLLAIGWVAAGLHSQEIFNSDSSFPLLNSHGEPGSCKTLAAETALSLVGTNWPQVGMLARVSTSALYEHGCRTGSLPFFWDDPERNPETEELAKNWYNWKPRKVRGNEQVPHAPMGITSNHVFGGDQAATYTRFIRLPFERASEGSKASFQELKVAQAKASGAFPQLLKLGCPKEAIASLEAELLPRLPLAHARIAQSLAIVTWYAQKVIDLTGGLEDMKSWVIDNLCSSENDADSSGDSLQDFVEKLLALESESKVGDWNLKRHVERGGCHYVAIYTADAWNLVDRRFKPATYNLKALKPLVIKLGGVVDTTVRFARSQDQVLAYERALIVPRMVDGVEVLPNPPETIPRKAWLIPAQLFGVTDVTECNHELVTPENDLFSMDTASLSSSCNHVTENKEVIEEKSNPSFNSVHSSPIEGSTPNSGYTVSAVTRDAQPLTQQPLEPVTSCAEKSVTTAPVSVTTPLSDSQRQLIQVQCELTAGILWKHTELTHSEMIRRLIDLKKRVGVELYSQAIAQLTPEERTILEQLRQSTR